MIAALPPPQLLTDRLLLRLASIQDASGISQYYCENRSFFTPVDPIRGEEFFTADFWQLQVEKNLLEFNCKQSLRLFIFEQTAPKRVIGAVNFTQFFRGPFQSCVLGYNLAETKQGKGLMTEALRGAIAYIFNDLAFHRVMANYMPRNQRSGNVLRRLGFTVEGYARDYLLINGKWEDHILTSLINPSWKLTL